ncbi:MAG TPA: universal stress protein, partial [Bryobacteraceae bacterium]|nr:universal stress protein [Bryobacteraceae bacterium]
KLGGHLVLVHVIAESEMQCSAGMTGLRVHPNIEEQFVRARQVTGAEAEYHLESGDVTRSLMQFVCRQKADLLVIGRSHWDANSEDKTPHAFEIVHRAPCPVVSVYRTRESKEAVA